MPEPRLFAVAGRPILHSLSPDLFRAGFAAAGIEARYTRLAAGDAAEILAIAEGLGCEGLNITSPFKESIVPLLDGLDETARRLAATNTVVRRDGRWIGYNTDPQGVLGALAAHGVDPRGKRAVVLGAGGAGRAAADGLSRAGSRVTIINRTRERAERAAADIGCGLGAWERRDRELETADVIVSCLAVREAIGTPDLVREGQVFLEAQYPRPSNDAGSPRRRGLFVSGESWLLHQAYGSFERFTGIPAPRRAMETALAEARPSNAKPGLALIGFMGAGKSTIGKLIAEKTGGTFDDTDALIESRTGLTIPALFARDGEAGFRTLESDVLRSLPFERGRICALGGGIVLDRGNRDIIRKNAVTFWIFSEPGKVLARLAGGCRPLLAGENAADEARSLFRERIGRYAEVGDAVVLNDDGAGHPEAAAERIIDEIRRLLPD